MVALRVSCIAAGVVLGMAGVAGAAGDVYRSRAAWQAAIAGEGILHRYDFEIASGFPAAPAKVGSFDGGRVTIISEDQEGSLRLFPEGSANQVLGGRMAEGDTLLSSRPFSLAFDPPVLALGLDLVDLMPAGTELASISVTGPGRGPTILYQVSDDDGAPGTPAFFGLANAGAIAHLDIYTEDPRCDAPFPCHTPNSIDDLDVVNVPEPAAGLAAISLVLWAVGRRGRRGLLQ